MAKTTTWVSATLCLGLCLQGAVHFEVCLGASTSTATRIVMNPTAIAASLETTSNIKLTCSYFSGILSATTVVWSKNHIEIAQSQLLSNSSGYSSSFDSNSGTAVFTLRKPQARDSGYYDCRAVINGSRVTSSQANVTIAKKILAHSYRVVRGLSVEVNCPIRNTIPSSSPVFWSRKGKEILSGGNYRHSNGRTIKIMRADYNDSGVYRCVVQTDEGLEDAQTTILVQDDSNVNTQVTARRSHSWVPALVTLSTVFPSEPAIALNVTDKPQQDGEITFTQFLVVVVLTAVVTISVFGLVVFAWFRYCYRKTGNYTTQEKAMSQAAITVVEG